MGARWAVDGSREGQCRLVVQGELDLAAEQSLVDDVEAVLAGVPDRPLSLDLSAVHFIDSSGVRALVRLRRGHGTRVRIEHLSAPVRKVLDIAGLLEHLGVDDGAPPDGTG